MKPIVFDPAKLRPLNRAAINEGLDALNPKVLIAIAMSGDGKIHILTNTTDGQVICECLAVAESAITGYPVAANSH